MLEKQNPITIIGVPLDLGASRRGTDAGPSAFRVAGLEEKLLAMGYEIASNKDFVAPLMETLKIKRADTNTSSHFKKEIKQICTDVAQATYVALEKGHFPLILGGDHSIAMGSVSGVSSFYRDKSQEIGLIWFDAHGDMNTPDSSPSGNIHGMPLAHILGFGDQDLIDILVPGAKIKPENVALIGIRDIDEKERQCIRNSGIHTFTMRDIDEKGIGAVSKEAIEIVTKNTAGFHLSFDLDGCDPSVILGTGTTVPGGLNYRESHLFLEICAESQQMRAMDVVELNPFLDHKNISAERAVSLIQSAFGQNIL